MFCLPYSIKLMLFWHKVHLSSLGRHDASARSAGWNRHEDRVNGGYARCRGHNRRCLMTFTLRGVGVLFWASVIQVCGCKCAWWIWMSATLNGRRGGFIYDWDNNWPVMCVKIIDVKQCLVVLQKNVHQLM